METATDTAQQLCRTEFDKQYTKEMLRELSKRTIALTKRYERHTPRRSTDTSQDRIHTAVMKFFDGSRTWDPSRVDLCGFLLGVIASDLSSEMRRSKMAPLVPIDDRDPPREDDYTGEPCGDSGTSLESEYPIPRLSASVDEAWSAAMSYLRKRAGTDARALALLGAWEEGVCQKRDVMMLLKWSAATYKDAYQRLVKLANEAEDSLREAIAYGLSN